MDDQTKTEKNCTAEQLLKIIWTTLADVLGTAATATLIRRSASRAAQCLRTLDGLTIQRQGFDYSYTVPANWHGTGPEPMTALRELVRELALLLIELTGPVVIRRLNTNSELQRHEILFQERSR